MKFDTKIISNTKNRLFLKAFKKYKKYIFHFEKKLKKNQKKN